MVRSLGGGEIHEYTSLLEDTRRQALDRLVKNATLMGGNAVVSMRFDSSELAGTMSEIVAYGTAVVVEPDVGRDPARRRVGRRRADDRMLTPTIRILAAGLGLLMLLGGLIAAQFAGLAGIWSTIIGAGILIAARGRAESLPLRGR